VGIDHGGFQTGVARKILDYKTVEIIVSEKDWSPPPARFPESAIVPLKIAVADKSLQSQVKALGGRWNPERKVWYVPYGCIVGTRLEKLITEEFGENPVKQKSL
jgi:hypothetical protein